MPIVTDWDLKLDVDGVLRGQGADPAAIRARSPHLVETAEQALDEARPLLQPQVLFERFPVEALRHEKLQLKGGGSLQGSLIAQHLGQAHEVIVLLCTTGTALENLVSAAMSGDQMLYGLALDGVGSAAVEALANQACRRFELEAEAQSYQTSIPLSPGMMGWSVAEGQPQIFNLIDAAAIGVTLTGSSIMVPRKSLSMVIGVGEAISIAGRTCDYCAMKDTCRYQDHYESAHG